MIVKCVVAATSGGVGPDFYFCKVECEQAEYDIGEHYELAEAAAAAEGYARPMVVFDEHDGPEWLFLNFDWSKAATVDSEEFED